MNITNKFTKTLNDNLKKYQNIVNVLKNKDVKESDTVTVIVDILSDVLGYDKYLDVTSEFAIKNTFCDLAIIDSQSSKKEIKILIEVKALGTNLNENHIKQAIDYGANEGVTWVILTNGEIWKIFKIKFAKPIDKELVYEFNFLQLSIKNKKDIEMLFAISKEGNKEKKSAIDDLYTQGQVKNKYIIGNLLLQNTITYTIKREIKKLFPDVKISEDEINDILKNSVLKNDIVSNDDLAVQARKTIEKCYRKNQKNTINTVKEEISVPNNIDNKE